MLEASQASALKVKAYITFSLSASERHAPRFIGLLGTLFSGMLSTFRRKNEMW